MKRASFDLARHVPVDGIRCGAVSGPGLAQLRNEKASRP